jgi:hypothetical protein
MHEMPTCNNGITVLQTGDESKVWDQSGQTGKGKERVEVLGQAGLTLVLPEVGSCRHRLRHHHGSLVG